MTEQSGAAARPEDAQQVSPAGAGKDADRPEGGRTDGQTAVDEALGSGDAPAE